MTAPLTAKQHRFVEEYLIDLNATKAAVRAGYSEHTADVQGPRLLGNVGVQAAIAEAMQERSRRTKIDADRVVREYAKLAFADLGMFVEWGADGVTIRSSSGLSPHLRAAVMEVTETKTEHGGTVKFKLHDKKGALDSLARHLGMFNDKLSIGAHESLATLMREIDGATRGLPRDKPVQ